MNIFGFWRTAFLVTLIVAGFSARARGQATSTPSPTGSPTSSTDSGPSSKQAPVYVEYLFGNDRFDLQTLISKRFSDTSPFGILSVTNAQGEYDNNLNSFDFVNVTQLSYTRSSGLGANVGLSINRQSGFNTTVGLQFTRHTRDFLFLISPSVFIQGKHDIQNVLVLQYQPPIKQNWRLYELALLVDDYMVGTNTDVRFLLHLRSGASYRKFTFGVGLDLDRYGIPVLSSRHSIGPFVAYSF